MIGRASFLFIVLIGGIILSCSQVSSENSNAKGLKVSGDSSGRGSKSFSKPMEGNSVIETFDDVSYKIDLLSAVEFIERKGERLSKLEIQRLKKESVLILEMQINDKVKSAYETDKLEMSKDDAISYLMGGIKSDVTITQKMNSFEPYEVMYDGHLTGANKLRVFLFFQDLDVTETAKIKFYDRLFGAGLINLKH